MVLVQPRLGCVAWLVAILFAGCSNERPAEPAAITPPVGDVIMTANQKSASVTMIEAQTGRIVAHIPVGDGPHEIAVSPDGEMAAVPLFGRGPLGGAGGGNQIAVIDVASASVRRVIDLSGIESPHGVVFLDDNRTAVAVSMDSEHVVFFDVEAGKLVDKIETGLQLYLIARPNGGRTVYASSPIDDTIAEVNVDSKQIVRKFQIPGAPGSMAVTDGDSAIWLLRPEGNAISVLDLKSGEIAQSFNAEGMPRRTAVSPDGKIVLATQASEVRVFDTASRQEVGRISLPEGVHASGVTFGPGGNVAYVTSPNTNSVFELDIAARNVVRKFETQTSPDGIIYVNRKP